MPKSKSTQSTLSSDSGTFDKFIETITPILIPLIVSGGAGAAVGGALTAAHATYGVVIGIIGGLILAKTLFKGHEAEGMIFGGIVGGIIAIAYSKSSANEGEAAQEHNPSYGKAIKCAAKELKGNITDIVSSVSSPESFLSFGKLALSLPNNLDNITECMGEGLELNNLHA